MASARPTVRGKFLFVGDQKLYLRGVTYGAFRPDARGNEYLERYRQAAARRGWRLASPPELDVLFDTAQRARCANRVIWPILALLRERANWGFPELAEVERWFLALDSASAVPPPV